MDGWDRGDGEVAVAIRDESQSALRAYGEQPKLIEEHASQERETRSGGYGRRQVFELIQNGADQLREGDGKIQIVLTKDALYCANGGRPFSPEGAVSILHAYLSQKDDAQIGRFGLGFKSVLGVSEQPMVLSRTGSFHFSEDVASTIREVDPGVDRVPLLRIAEPFDPREVLSTDAVAGELAAWAATIVRLPFDVETLNDTSRLSNDIAVFPSEFLVFADMVESLILEDRVNGNHRTIVASKNDDQVEVREGERSENWVVFQRAVDLRQSVRESAGKLGDREAATVKWAVPTSTTRGEGQFWSYFPTDDRTTLKGVLNAPWQLNQDRTNLVEGEYNEEMIEGAAELVAESLAEYRAVTQDELRYLSLLPGRGKEGRNWADDHLTEMTNGMLARNPSLPLISGELEIPVRARVHPENLPEAALKIWLGLADTEGWVHHGIDQSRDHRARVDRYLKGAGIGGPVSVEDWFKAALPGDGRGPGDGDTRSDDGTDFNDGNEAEATDDEVSTDEYVQVLKLAGTLMNSGASPESPGVGLEQLREMTIIPAKDGELHAASNPKLMIPGSHPPHDSSVLLVSDLIAADDEALAVLRQLGVKRVSAEGELRRLVENSLPESKREWEHFWSVVREMPVEMALSILRDSPSFVLRTRVLSGDFKNVRMCLLPGICVSEDDAESTIDQRWHRAELNLLQALGCDDQPRPGGGSESEPWFEEYRDEAVREYLAWCHPAKISAPAVEVDTLDFAGPLMPIRALSDRGRAKFTDAMLRCSGGLSSVLVRHSTQPDRYGQMTFADPVTWMIKTEGRFETPWGPRPPEDCVSPSLAFGDLAPSARCASEVSEKLELPEEWSKVSEELIEAILERSLETDGAPLGALYGSLAKAGIPAPTLIRCFGGGVEQRACPDEVMLCRDQETEDLLAGGSGCFLRSEDESGAEALISRWKLQDAAILRSKRIARVEQGEPIPLIDLFPALKRSLDPEEKELELLRCEEIRVIDEIAGAGTKSKDEKFIRDGRSLLCSEDLRDEEILSRVSAILGLDLDEEAISRIIQNAEDDKIKKIKNSARKAESDDDRLLALLGEEAISAGIPGSIKRTYESIYDRPQGANLAALARSIHGVELLKHYSNALDERGITTPASWGGRRPAKEFVRSLGFPEELAGFERRAPSDVEVVEGRPNLNPLHGYQEKIVEELCGLLAGGGKGKRSMLVLPTGAGKTRVAVEGIIRAVGENLISPTRVLWVAQSEELCEQAVQAWNELWRAQGMEQRLTIGRLWSSRDVEEVVSGAQVVVATIQKLGNLIEDPDYEWLTDSGVVIVDEAHGSITRSYTTLFRWLGLGAKDKDGPPLIGLSATPYRGRDSEETKRLAKRYGNSRLDIKALGEEDHLSYFQDLGVISRVEHRTLDGTEIELDPSEKVQLETSNLMPKTADTRIGEDIDRTRSIIESIAGLPDSWPVLVFAPSVENSQALAGLLNHAGIPAASISGETPKEARRWYIDAFKKGDLRVITNYNVLAEGFDAPAVRAVYVARPVYAPNRYQQMVGRGLRGVENGGKEECLIVDVKDNILNFDGKLAFHEFEYLWNPEPVGSANL